MRVREQLVDERLRGCLQLAGWDDAVDEPDAVRLGGVDRGGGHDQLLRAAEPDDRGQARGTADVGDDPELDLGQAELRIVGGDPQVATERDLNLA